MAVVGQDTSMTVECDGCGETVTCAGYPKGWREIRACVEVRGFGDQRLQWTELGHFCPTCVSHRAWYAAADAAADAVQQLLEQMEGPS